MAATSVLIVEDDERLARQMGRWFEGRRVLLSSDAASARALAAEHRLDLAIVDYVLRNSSGLDLVGDLRAAFPALQIGFISGDLDLELARQCTFRGASWFLEKPFDREKLMATLDANARAPRQLVVPSDLTLDTNERNHIARVLELNGGNRTAAARDLGIRRTTLQRKLRDDGGDGDESESSGG